MAAEARHQCEACHEVHGKGERIDRRADVLLSDHDEQPLDRADADRTTRPIATMNISRSRYELLPNSLSRGLPTAPAPKFAANDGQNVHWIAFAT